MNEKREEVMLADGRIFWLADDDRIVRKVDPLSPHPEADQGVLYDELWATLVAENKSRLEAIERWRFQLTDEWNIEDGGKFANR